MAQPKRPDTRKAFDDTQNPFPVITGKSVPVEAPTTEVEEPSTTESVYRLRAQDLKPLPGQPRRHFNTASLNSLAASIQERGILQPLLVRPDPDGSGYQIVAGERRWRAAQIAQVDTLPVVIHPMTDSEARTAALIENLQREDLNPVDRTDATVQLIAETLKLDAADVPARLRAYRKRPDEPDNAPAVQALESLFGLLGGSWQTFAVHGLPILNYPPEVLTAMREQGLEYTKGAVIARVQSAARREVLLRSAIEHGASLEELRAAANEHQPVPEERAQLQRVARSLSWRRVEQLAPQERKKVSKLVAELERLLST